MNFVDLQNTENRKEFIADVLKKIKAELRKTKKMLQ